MHLLSCSETSELNGDWGATICLSRRNRLNLVQHFRDWHCPYHLELFAAGIVLISVSRNCVLLKICWVDMLVGVTKGSSLVWDFRVSMGRSGCGWLGATIWYTITMMYNDCSLFFPAQEPVLCCFVLKVQILCFATANETNPPLISAGKQTSLNESECAWAWKIVLCLI